MHVLEGSTAAVERKHAAVGAVARGCMPCGTWENVLHDRVPEPRRAQAAYSEFAVWFLLALAA